MDVKKLVLLCGALVLAVITAIMAKNMFSGASAPVAQAAPVSVPTGPQVLVATKSLPVGTIVDAESLRYQPWPKELIQDAYFVEGKGSAQSLVGTVVRNPITAGQPITQGALVKPGDRGFLAAALGPGMRAVTVPVSAQSAVAGFIFPGDHVDLVLTQTVTGGGDGPPLKASETFIRNLRVLATDQKTTAATDADGKTQVTPASTVTVEATPKIAEKIAVAQTVGSLSLSLRSIADNNAGLEQAIASGTVKVPDNADPATEKKMMLEIAARPDDNGETFSTGADVSRFQRSTVPAAPKTGAEPQPMGAAPAVAGATVTGPAVRIARGNTVTVVPVGGK